MKTKNIILSSWFILVLFEAACASTWEKTEKPVVERRDPIFTGTDQRETNENSQISVTIVDNTMIIEAKLIAKIEEYEQYDIMEKGHKEVTEHRKPDCRPSKSVLDWLINIPICVIDTTIITVVGDNEKTSQGGPYEIKVGEKEKLSRTYESEYPIPNLCATIYSDNILIDGVEKGSFCTDSTGTIRVTIKPKKSDVAMSRDGIKATNSVQSVLRHCRLSGGDLLQLEETAIPQPEEITIKMDYENEVRTQQVTVYLVNFKVLNNILKNCTD